MSDSMEYNASASSESSDSYNGWTNRETWALNLWLSNDQGLYEMTRERVADIAPSMYEEQFTDEQNNNFRAYRAGQAVKSLTEELLDPEEQLMTPENIITILSDVGSLYRVNWDEIGAAFLEAIEED